MELIERFVIEIINSPDFDAKLKEEFESNFALNIKEPII